MKKIFTALGLLPLLALCLAACAQSRTQAARDPGQNLTQAKREVAAYHESGRHGRDVAEVADRAGRYLDKRLESPVQGRPAVVFDLDETLVSNHAALKKDDFRYQGPGSETWTSLLMANQGEPIQPVLELYARLRDAGVALFIVSERPPAMRGPTAKRLFEAGFGGWTGLYLSRPLAGENEAGAKARVRRMIQDQGFAILANIGDQEADLAEGAAEQPFKLPNRMYAYE